MNVSVKLMRWLAGCLLGCAQVFALGFAEKGNHIAGRIAENHLTNRAPSEGARLLGGQSMSSVSTWGDLLWRERRETASWHFVGMKITTDRILGEIANTPRRGFPNSGTHPFR
ncbi:MAG: hypothetical protein NTY46_02145 [Candidatus Sumerlaeota bacterium]|nr:hypothetical protein [Candidatus Sumerlaeota bacterium]